jgi:ketosteroid isomerase-like protein
MNRPTVRFSVHIMLVLLGLILSTRAFPKSLDSSAASRITKAVTEVLSQQQSAWNNGDIPAFMNGYWKSPELSFSGSSGVSRGWEGVLARYQRSYPNKSAMGYLDFSGLELHPLGDSAALVLGKWHLKRDSGDVGGVFTLVFQCFPEGWKIIHDHTSQVQPQKP